MLTKTFPKTSQMLFTNLAHGLSKKNLFKFYVNAQSFLFWAKTTSNSSTQGLHSLLQVQTNVCQFFLFEEILDLVLRFYKNV
jgi:hypothetical protein